MKKKLTECDQCSGSVERIPLNEVNVAKPPNASPTKTGSVVKKNIEEFRKALKEEKKRLSKVEYK